MPSPRVRGLWFLMHSLVSPKSFFREVWWWHFKKIHGKWNWKIHLFGCKNTDIYVVLLLVFFGFAILKTPRTMEIPNQIESKSADCVPTLSPNFHPRKNSAWLPRVETGWTQPNSGEQSCIVTALEENSESSFLLNLNLGEEILGEAVWHGGKTAGACPEWVVWPLVPRQSLADSATLSCFSFSAQWSQHPPCKV